MSEEKQFRHDVIQADFIRIQEETREDLEVFSQDIRKILNDLDNKLGGAKYESAGTLGNIASQLLAIARMLCEAIELQAKNHGEFLQVYLKDLEIIDLLRTKLQKTTGEEHTMTH